MASELRRQIITVGEEILTEEAQALYRSLRKGTEYCDNTTDYRLNPGSLRTTYLALFINKAVPISCIEMVEVRAANTNKP